MDVQKSHAARLPYKTCRNCMIPQTKSPPDKRETIAFGIPYKSLQKPNILETRIALAVQKIHAARLPYETCRKCMIPQMISPHYE